MNIGTKIRKIREQFSLSQDEMAAKLDISQSTLCKIESGNIEKVDFVLINKICDLFKIDFKYFLEDYISQSLYNNTNTNSAFTIFGNPTVNNIPDNIFENIIKNQEQITVLLDLQNKLIEKLVKNE